MAASSYWDMRLSVACTATDAEFQNRIIQRDRTLNFPVVAQQPNPDPNFQLRASLCGASSCARAAVSVPEGAPEV